MFGVPPCPATPSPSPPPSGSPPPAPRRRRPRPRRRLTPPSVASEPLFVDIVQRAGQLKAETKAYENGPLDGGVDQLKDFSAFETAVAELSDLDMQGHVDLVQRGYTDDLKCILKGISQDLPVKLKALEAAARPEGAPRRRWRTCSTCCATTSK